MTNLKNSWERHTFDFIGDSNWTYNSLLNFATNSNLYSFNEYHSFDAVLKTIWNVYHGNRNFNSLHISHALWKLISGFSENCFNYFDLTLLSFANLFDSLRNVLLKPRIIIEPKLDCWGKQCPIAPIKHLFKLTVCFYIIFCWLSC